MKNRFLMTIFISAVFITALFILASCADKRASPTLIIVPAKTATITKTALPTRTRTPTVTPTFTVTPTSTPYQLFYHFDTDLEGWDTNYVDMAFTAIAQTTAGGDPKFAGAGSVKFTTAFGGNTGGNTAGGFAIGLGASPPNFTGKTITVNIWLPASMAGQDYNVDVYIWDSSWAEQKATFNLSAGYTGDSWNAFTYSPSGPGIDVIMMLGIRITQNPGAPDVSDDVFLDEISIL